MSSLPLVSIPCVDEDAAERFLGFLADEEVDEARRDGRHVLVPTSYPPFAFDLAEAAVTNCFAHDHEAARAAAEFVNTHTS